MGMAMQSDNAVTKNEPITMDRIPYLGLSNAPGDHMGVPKNSDKEISVNACNPLNTSIQNIPPKIATAEKPDTLNSTENNLSMNTRLII